MTFDLEAASAAFALPNCDGSFEPEFADYLRELGETRPSVILAFAPKAAGTYLRSAAIVATGGQLVRTVHAQGGRDASFYLPTFLAYYASGYPAKPLVTHVHMQALPANQHFLNVLDLKPVIMLRPIPDMLASYADMLQADPLSPDNWLNMRLPPDYAALDKAAQGDFLIDMMGPWYASYFATWQEYAAAAPGRVLVLDYDAFKRDPVTALERLLDHSGLPRSREACQTALEAVWEERADFRFNKGVSGRGHMRFTRAQIGRLERQLAFYPNLDGMRDGLIRPPSTSSVRMPSAAA
jgi:hypothetical protein